MMHGKNRIGNTLVSTKLGTVSAVTPATGETLSGSFEVAGDSEIQQSMEAAASAFETYRRMPGTRKAEFLEAIAEEIIALGDELIERASQESALPVGRITGERGRTVGQLRMFATLLREGSWVEATLEPAMPDREPLPRADIRKMLVPTGPVIVFTASNFPLAFSTAGGDTASALAAGNPVIVKAHESHLGTNELVSDAIARAAEKTNMPNGVYSSLVGSGYELGQKLVQHPLTKSVAFTGSYRGGKALYDLANEREEPIPVFAEMGSINPVFLLPDTLEKNGTELAKTYAGSITLGVGQFCTNPGLMIGLESDALTQYTTVLGEEIANIEAGNMLNAGIASSYRKGLSAALEQKGVSAIQVGEDKGASTGHAALAKVAAADFIANLALAHEIFGPYSLLVVCSDEKELKEVVASLKGQLTATFMGTEEDFGQFAEIISQTAECCGRLIFNNVPTGVEVCHGMQHGGPFPASTDSRFTSVGTGAIKRFVRPLCFQNAPTHILPDELKSGNPLGIWRNIDGKMTKDSI